MTPEDLLKPRYKVIAGYPDMPFEVGEIIIEENLGATINPFYQVGRFGFSNSPSLYYPEKYPSNFRLLKWWEERKPEEMAAYVKDIGHNTYHKVDRYDEAGKFSTAMRMVIEPHSWAVIENVMCFFEPATESEYLNSLNKQ